MKQQSKTMTGPCNVPEWTLQEEQRITHEILVPGPVEYSNIKFGFIGTAEEAIDEYHRLFAIFHNQGGPGMPQKEWNETLDMYLDSNVLPGGADTWEKLSKFQRDVIQECKKSYKRRN